MIHMSMDANDELPELDISVLEEFDNPNGTNIAKLPAAAASPNPFEDPLQTPAAAPSKPANETLSMDDLGGNDFDLPIPPAGGGGGIAAKPIMATRPPAPRVEARPPSPGFGAFKWATPAFASTPNPFAAAAPSIAATPAPEAVAARPAPIARAAEAMVNPKNLFADEPTDPQVLRALLTGDGAVGEVPPEALKFAFQLCRVLIKKGVISPDDLL